MVIIYEESVTNNMKFTLSYNGKSYSFNINNNLVKLTIT